MSSRRYIPLNLRIPAFITGSALVCIIALQVYWLALSYAEQKARFAADIENALTATSVSTQINTSLQGFDSSITSMVDNSRITDLVTEAISKLPAAYIQEKERSDDTVHLNVDASALLKMSKKDLKTSLNALKQLMDSQGQFRVNLSDRPQIRQAYRQQLSTYRSTFALELNKRHIHTPFELAIRNSRGFITMATCDTSLFKNIPVKSATDGASLQFLPDGGRLQAAFPDANLLLLRRMLWILSVTGLLILICGLSFGYLIIHFFRQKRLSDMRNDFMNNMTHELKTPISSVSVALELMSPANGSDSAAANNDYLAIARSELARLNLLVDKILNIAAFERNEVQHAPERLEATVWIGEVVNAMKPLVAHRGAKLEVTVEPPDTVLYGDRIHLTNVMQNLIGNAIKYNDKPEPIINIAIDHVPGDEARIRISDNGKGIPEAYLDKVFDKFFRVPTGDRHDVKGYGLGLSYVKEVVTLHGGRVTVDSMEGKGSSFTIHLPATTDH